MAILWQNKNSGQTHRSVRHPNLHMICFTEGHTYSCIGSKSNVNSGWGPELSNMEVIPRDTGHDK